MLVLGRIQRVVQQFYNVCIGTYSKLIYQNDKFWDKIYVNYDATHYILFKNELVIASQVCTAYICHWSFLLLFGIISLHFKNSSTCFNHQ